MLTDEFGQLEVTSCWPCIVSLHQECRAPESDTCCCGGADYLDSPEIGTAAGRGGGVGPRVLDPGEVTDPTSTGRKRAAMLYPIMPGMVCEWAGLQNAGGGVVPIIGCDWNLIWPGGKTGGEGSTGDIHHGPSKSTLRNDPENVHRICRSCHHSWHSTNDVYYGKVRPKGGEDWYPLDEFPWVPHDPFTEATEDDLALANARRDSQNPRASAEQIADVRARRVQRRDIFTGHAAIPEPPELL